MPEMVRIGGSGPAVIFLQAQLNLHLPHSKPPLDMDGLFGPKTQARVLEFQRNCRLAVDGIVGPMSWGALTRPAPQPEQPRSYVRCGNGDPGNRGMVERIALACRDLPAHAVATGGSAGAYRGSAAPASSAAFTPITVGGIAVAPLAGDPLETVASSVYGDSLDYTRIFMSDIAGAQSRAFTVALPARASPTGHPMVVLNLGTFSPSRETLIHELGHAWQSQHHSNPVQFMANCTAFQARALATNKVIAVFDESVESNPRFPTEFPFSPYGFIAGDPLGSYAGEQVAQQIVRGKTSIVSHVAGRKPGHDPENEKSLAVDHLKVQDMRMAGAEM